MTFPDSTNAKQGGAHPELAKTEQMASIVQHLTVLPKSPTQWVPAQKSSLHGAIERLKKPGKLYTMEEAKRELGL